MSKWVLMALLAVTVVLLGLFFFVGFDNEIVLPGQEKPLTDPQFLPALMYWMYILVIVPIVLIVVYQSIGLVKKFMDNPKEAAKGLVGPILAVGLIVVSYFIAASSDSNSLEAIQNGTVAPILINNVICEDTGAMVLTDTLIYVQYVLALICVIVTVISLTGLFKYVNKVK
ncbi:MAG: hypothetical protein J6R07_01635 [Bacteroidaceae bacterium]|nr:hypothetical protein [Bacteroidaceae bacterium]